MICTPEALCGVGPCNVGAEALYGVGPCNVGAEALYGVGPCNVGAEGCCELHARQCYHTPLASRCMGLAMVHMVVVWALVWSGLLARVHGLGMAQTPSLPAVEMEVLRELYEATSGPDWVIFGVPWNFSGAPNPCEEGWEGVECTCQGPDVDELHPYTAYAPPEYLYYYYYDDGAGVLGAPCHVSKLSLGFTHLQGTLPTSLGHLVFLTRLHMEQNHIGGSIPSSIASLAGLEYIMLFINSLTGSIPTSLGYLTGMQILSLVDNYLTGSIPTSLGYLTAIEQLLVDRNSLTGSIPTSFGYLSGMQLLSQDTNSLTGCIPSSLGYMTQMQLLYLFTNSLTGSIPTSLGYLTSMLFLGLFANSLTGYIPTSLGFLTQMQLLYLFSNSLTGYIPTSLGYLTEMQLLSLYTNSLTGSIPTSLGYLTGMQNLGLYTNSLTGSIPTSLGYLTRLEILVLYRNLLTGSIPISLANCSSLNILQLYDNSLSGHVMNVFNPQLQSSLQVIDLSSNRLTGTLPSAVFQIHTLTSIAMVKNCFTGTLPSEMCSATSLQVLALDGLHTAESCQDRFFPSSNIITTYDLPPSQSMRGTIPSCLFSMPNLTTLHLSGNGFTGSIGDISLMLTNIRLVDLNLAHNILTGSIPNWVQGRQWSSLNLGYNRLSGTLESAMSVVGANSSLALNVNRLSGDIPSSLKRAQSITILRGNLFGCGIDRASLPSNDPDVGSYQCGSNAINVSLAVWAVLLCCWVFVIFFLFLCAHNVRQALELSSLQSAVSSNLRTCAHASMDLVKGREGFDVKSRLLWSALNIIRIFSATMAGACCIVLIPLFGGLSVEHRTHSYVYTWAVSASYLSGSVAAGVIVAVWAIVGGVACWGTAKFLAVDNSKSQNETAVSGKDDESRWRRIFVQVSMLVVFVALNLAVMGSVNAVYVILVTSGALNSADAVTGVAIVLGVIKAGWNSFVLPNTFDHLIQRKLGGDGVAMKPHIDDATGQLVLHTLAIVNNILLPCIVEALVDTNCFYNVIFQAPAIDVSYTYSYCSLFGASASDCFQISSSTTSAFYSPPFIYNYQCTSALLTNYASVYVYSITFSSFIVPIASRLWLWLRSRGGKGEAADFNPRELSTRLMCLFAICVTFGAVFPLLSVVVLVAVLLETAFAEARMARFVAMAGSEAEARERKAAMDAADAEVMDSFVSSVWLLLPLSASFNAFFVFDILGDEVGWEQGLGGLVAVMIVLPVLIWGGYKAWYRWGGSGELTCGVVQNDGDAAQKGTVDVEMVEMVDAFNETFLQSDERYTINPMSSLNPIAIPHLSSIVPTPNTDR